MISTELGKSVLRGFSQAGVICIILDCAWLGVWGARTVGGGEGGGDGRRDGWVAGVVGGLWASF